MIQAMYNGVSGLRAHKTMMDVISNNIANVNTVGFKVSRTNFREAFSQTLRGATAPTGGGNGGTNPTQIGLGVAIGAIDINQNQGSLQPTGKLTDFAIEGAGFFVLSDGQSKSFSRDGSFTIDADGNLVSAGSGLRVLGWMADKTTGVIDPNPADVKSIKLPVGQLARPTSTVTYNGNLDAGTVTGEEYTVSSVTYDSLGEPHTLDITFLKVQNPMVSQGYAASTAEVGDGSVTVTLGAGTDDVDTINFVVAEDTTLAELQAQINGHADLVATLESNGPAGAQYYIKLSSVDGRQATINVSNLTGGTAPSFSAENNNWTWTASVGGTASGTGTLAFDNSGRYSSSTGSVAYTPQAGADPMGIDVDFSAVSQYSGGEAGLTNISAASQDGLPVGMLQTFTIGMDGIISGVFTNGQSQPLAQIALAVFNNPAGLTKSGNNLLITSSNSGDARISTPSIGSMGRVISGALESSNVDLPTEFANMIVAQRGFQANSRVITTSDEILMELVQLKR